MENQWQDFPEAFLIRLDDASTTVNDVPDVPTFGEIMLARLPSQDLENPDDEENPDLEAPVARYELLRAAFMLNSVAVAAGETGIISITARTGSVPLEIRTNEDGFLFAKLEIPLACFVAVEAMEGGYFYEDDGQLEPFHAHLQGSITLNFQREDEPGEEVEHINNWRLSGLGFSAERAFIYERETYIETLGGAWEDMAHLLSISLDAVYPASTTTGFRREIRVRPIWLTNGAQTADTRTAVLDYIRTQILESQEVWSRALVNIVVSWAGNDDILRNAEVVNAGILAEGRISATTQYSNSRTWLTAIRNFANTSAAMANLRPVPGTIDIYFTKWFDSPVIDTFLIDGVNTAVNLPNSGGGRTLGSNTAIACIIASDRRLPARTDTTIPPSNAGRRWMDYLIAHELGHVLGLAHPTDTNLRSDGNLNFPFLTAKAFRWNDSAINPRPDLVNCSGTTNEMSDTLRITRMCNIMRNFDEFWKLPVGATPPREPAYNWPRDLLLNDILVDIVPKTPVGMAPPFPRTNDIATRHQRLQALLDAFADEVDPADIPAANLNPIFVLFISDDDPNAIEYETGFVVVGTAPNRFTVPVFVFNKEVGVWGTYFNEANGGSAADFRNAIFRHLKQPWMFRAGFGTIMEPETPDPSVIDLDICQAVTQGQWIDPGTINARYVSTNPAARYLGTTGLFRPDSRFGMYIPSVKGDVGRLTRPESGVTYSSPYLWNRTNANRHSTAELQSFRTSFFEPNADQPSHNWPATGTTNHIYVHVRLRANNLPAALTSASSLSAFFNNQTRVFVAARYPGASGITSFYQIGGTWRAILEEQINTNIPNQYTPLASFALQREARPFVAGLSFRIEWDATITNLPSHACIFAMVINAGEDLLDEAGDINNPLLRFTTANAMNWDFGAWLTNLTTNDPGTLGFLVRENLQFIQRNMDMVPLPPAFSMIKMFMAPMGFGADGLPEGFAPIYEISVRGIVNAQLAIETFNGEEQVLEIIDGKARFDAAGTELRPGVYGMAFSLQFPPDQTIEETIVIEYNARYGEYLLDGFHFEIRIGDETEFLDKVFNSALFALNAYQQSFGTELVEQIRNTLLGLSNTDPSDLLNWLQSSAAQSALNALTENIQSTFGNDSIMLNNLLNDLSNTSNEQILMNFKAFCDRLHFIVMLNNGTIKGHGGASASVRKGETSRSLISPEKTEAQGCIKALRDFILKLLN